MILLNMEMQYMVVHKLTAFFLGPVVQGPISTNPGLTLKNSGSRDVASLQKWWNNFSSNNEALP